MKLLQSRIKISVFIFISMLFVSACNEDSSPLENETATTNEAALKQIVEADEAYLSFEPAYNEEDAMSIAPKTDETIYPVRVGQRMQLVDVVMDFEVVGDSAFGTVTKYFNGRLFIAASLDEYSQGDSNVVDTLITKDFETKITRKFKFVKIANTDFPRRNWKIAGISLPEGGTITDGNFSENIIITQLTVTLSDGSELVIDSPNEYFLSRGTRDQIPVIGRFESALLTVKIQSVYEADDFVTLTFGAGRDGLNRAKKRFDLVSSEFDGVYYNKVYQAEYTTHRFPGYFHAVINAIPAQVVNDDVTPVEEHSWGVPYKVN